MVSSICFDFAGHIVNHDKSLSHYIAIKTAKHHAKIKTSRSDFEAFGEDAAGRTTKNISFLPFFASHAPEAITTAGIQR